MIFYMLWMTINITSLFISNDNWIQQRYLQRRYLFGRSSSEVTGGVDSWVVRRSNWEAHWIDTCVAQLTFPSQHSWREWMPNSKECRGSKAATEKRWAPPSRGLEKSEVQGVSCPYVVTTNKHRDREFISSLHWDIHNFGLKRALSIVQLFKSDFLLHHYFK